MILENLNKAYLLLNITGDPSLLKEEEFKDYISDYAANPGEFNIDISSEYYTAIVWASDNLDEAWKYFQSTIKCNKLAELDKEELLKLVMVQESYIEFLDAGYAPAWSIAHAHGYKFPQSTVDEGIEYRETITSIKKL